MSSTSDEEFLGFENETVNNRWQVVKTTSTKRRKINMNNTNQLTIKNQFNALSVMNEDTTQQSNSKPDRIPKPPPIFIYGVIDYGEMEKKLKTIAANEEYSTKCLTDNTIKVISSTPDTYRKLIKFMRDDNIVHHTYQPKEERAYRIVVKHLHHTTDINLIKQELANKGHQTRNIINGRNRQTKEPLNIFFVDLEPANNNKEIYELKYLHNRAIQIEPPRRTKGITQCMRCQQYGHSRTYCNRPFVCVKCGGSHNTATCKKSKESPATCALCGGAHPANYKGCEFYHKLLKTNNANNRQNIQQIKRTATNNEVNSTTQKQQTPPTLDNQQYPRLQSHWEQTNLPHHHQQHTRSYANAANNITQSEQPNDINKILNKFLEEFKIMFQQLIQQNTMMLNMLTTLVSKIH